MPSSEPVSKTDTTLRVRSRAAVWASRRKRDDEARVVGELRREDLDRDGADEDRVLAAVDLRHPAPSELVLDAVAVREHHRLL